MVRDTGWGTWMVYGSGRSIYKSLNGVNGHQRASTMEEALNNQVVQMIWAVDICYLLH